MAEISPSAAAHVQPVRLERLETHPIDTQINWQAAADSEPTGGANRRRALHAVKTLGKGLSVPPKRPHSSRLFPAFCLAEDLF